MYTQLCFLFPLHYYISQRTEPTVSNVISNTQYSDKVCAKVHSITHLSCQASSWFSLCNCKFRQKSCLTAFTPFFNSGSLQKDSLLLKQQVLLTASYHSERPSSKKKIYKQTINAERLWREGNPPTRLVRMLIDTATMQNSIMVVL